MYHIAGKFGVKLKAHLHGSNLHALECQYLEKRGPKVQDYIISCNSNITSFQVLSTTDYIPDVCAMASLCSVNYNFCEGVPLNLVVWRFAFATAKLKCAKISYSHIIYIWRSHTNYQIKILQYL